MTKEITRPQNWRECQEATAFKGLWWGEWKHHLLDFLELDDFPDSETEELLHRWWCLRLSFKNGEINFDEFNSKKNELFPLEDDPLEKNEVLRKSVLYITNKLGSSDGNSLK